MFRPYFHLSADPRFRYPRAGGTSWSPAQIAAAYQFPQLAKVTPQTIGVIELSGGWRLSDINAAFAAWKLPAPQLTDVSVQGGRNSPGDPADGEVVLDIEIAAAIYSWCTGLPARIRTYFCPNTDSAFADAVLHAQADDCAVLSISWGGPERSWGNSIQAFAANCKAAADAGLWIFAASGDNGSGDGETGVNCDYPSSDPNVIGCGGTTKTRTSESVWGSAGIGTGGGYSSIFPAQPWQIGAPAGPGRMVPDVAGVADPQTGWEIYLNGQWTVIGGTSAVAPMYAGLFAALAGARAAAGLPKGSGLGRLLWSHPAAFSDVLTGNNGQWRASVGPDPCTGLGVPIGTALQQVIAPAPVIPPIPPPVTIPSPPVAPPDLPSGWWQLLAKLIAQPWFASLVEALLRKFAGRNPSLRELNEAIAEYRVINHV